ncbi:pentapeptide repeat-containing protein [Amycolatopsis roodepoortensis]|uniref:Uncharacterized protein YjbI with pentapeptide repeats n=1 Tax=Amycolatopsis roodepoortensis TaxID=700274 RepID=A0ABR9LAM0_9PSEU|nr:pentapeptide repeat-containing protein [Amycolatopsis roodepoortensis]MBE1577743.1 uncharacterized protein YjbI with pentapeptide repeats [Amycolatopsis roodepoortensis]
MSGLAGSAGGQRQPALDLIKIALTLTGGVGGVIVLVVAYRKQRLGEAAERREVAASRREEIKLFTERFMKAAEQLGNATATVRLAGVYAMADLADESIERRQTCINVLCGHLRMHCSSEPPVDPVDLAQWRGERQVRHTIFRVIADHLREDAPTSWQGHDFDFTGALIDGADFHEIRVTGGNITFQEAVFPRGKVDFDGAIFSGGVIDFSNASVSGGTVNFGCVKFAGSVVHFFETEVHDGGLDFSYTRLSAGALNLDDMILSSGRIDFHNATFIGARVTFSCTKFDGAHMSFREAKFRAGSLALGDCQFSSGSSVEFGQAEFAGGYVGIHRASYSGGVLNFADPTSWDTPPEIDLTSKGALAAVRMPGFVAERPVPA